ncbi:MAG: hypothetical protein J0H86_20510 [Xanthomonadaceae bacterium]|nr:hypothetical protein [Xanthomonadaceae bacterium]
MRKRTSQQRQREMASRTRNREGGSRRRRERRGGDAPQWTLLRVVGALEQEAVR